MSSRRSHRLRSLVLVAATAVAVPLLGAPSVALAEDPVSGDTVVGELVQAWPEYENPADAVANGGEGPLSWIEPETGDAVRVPTEDVADLEVGATVEVIVGDEVVDTASAEGQETAREVLAAEVLEPAASEPPVAPATAPFTNSVTMVMVVPSGGTQDARTLAQVVAAVNGPVADFWEQESNGSIKVGVTAQHDWMAAAAACGNPTALWNEVAAAVGFTSGTGKHLMLYLPQTSTGCSYGLAQVGSGPTSGGRLYVRDTVTSVIAHELGHNLGLGHSSGVQCNAAVETGTCRTRSYYDFYDVMGISWSQVGSLNAPHAARLGVLPPAQQAAVAAGGSGSFTLAPVSGRSGTRAVKLTDPDGAVYWLEYRPGNGQDGWLGSAPYGLQSGVLLRRAGGSNDTSLLFDGTPSASAGWDADMQVALPVGSAIPVSGGDFYVTVQSVTASSATVRVAEAVTGHALPRGSLDGLSVSGTTLSATGWAFDPDSSWAPSQVHAYVDGGGTAVVASQSRPDVGAAFPEAGDAHGFSWSAPVSPGWHWVCLYAIDSQISWQNTPFGCRAINVAANRPIGTWDAMTVVGTTLSVSGWAFDPDSASAPSPVHVYVDGGGTALTANGSRPDVGAVYPSAGPSHGFAWSGQVTPGWHWVCVYAVDAEISWRNSPFGCGAVQVAAQAPKGRLDAVSLSGSTLSLSGWAFDPDSPAVPSQVHVYLDGGGTALVANESRPDVGAVFPNAGPAHGFSWSTSLTPGAHSLCVYAIDSEVPWRNLPFGCRTVTA